MIWTYCNGEWKSRPIHMTQAEWKAAFLCCPGPSLDGLNPLSLHRPGIFTAAINSAYPKITRPDIWIGGDTPECHHPNLMIESFPKIFPGALADRKEVRVQFNTHYVDNYSGAFMSNADPDSTSMPKSTFLMALELLIKMGFLRIYLVGCDLGGERDYWHDQVLTPELREANKGVHQYIVDELSKKIRMLDERGVTLFSCSPESPLNGKLLKFVPIYQAIEREAKNRVTPDFRFRHVLEIKGKRDVNGQFARVGFTEE